MHSYEIRGGRGSFSWLKNPERAVQFLPELERFLVGLPVIGIAAIIHRPGYVARYEGRPWRMDKTAFSILIERSAKHARSKGRRLRVFFERSGKQEDQDIVAFLKGLKSEGMPFDGDNAAAYGGLEAHEFRELVLGEPKGRTKKTPMLQIADLYLYPMAKAGYDASYKPCMTGFHLRDHKVIHSGWGAGQCGQSRLWESHPFYGSREIPLPCAGTHRGAGCGGQTISAEVGRTVEPLAL